MQNITLMEALMGFSREVKHLDGRLIKIDRAEAPPPPLQGYLAHKKRRYRGTLLMRNGNPFQDHQRTLCAVLL